MRLTDGTAPIMGKFYHEMMKLSEKLDALFVPPSPFAAKPFKCYQKEILEIWEYRWEYMHCDYHSAAFALDPNFWELDVNGINEGEVFLGLSRTISRLHYDNLTAAALALEQYATFRDKQGIFSDPAVQAMSRTTPAAEWWNVCGGSVKELRHVAVRVLSKNSSASASERNWSAFQAVQTPKRTRLEPTTLNSLVYLRSNLRLLQKRTDPTFSKTVAAWVEETADVEEVEETVEEIDTMEEEVEDDVDDVASMQDDTESF
jgi:hypothetical protein